MISLLNKEIFVSINSNIPERRKKNASQIVNVLDNSVTVPNALQNADRYQRANANKYISKSAEIFEKKKKEKKKT